MGYDLPPSSPPARTPFRKDFPDVIVQQQWDSDVRLASHPDYKAAKAGSLAAAMRVVDDIVEPHVLEELRELIGSRKPLVVAVHAEEATGRNKLPIVYAEMIGRELDLPVDDEIVQANRPRRTGKGADYRLMARARFDGPVVPGRDYLLVDDNVTQGGTLADLKGYIEARGGVVIGATALAAGEDSELLAPRPQTLYDLRRRFPDLETWWRDNHGYGFDALTNSEARALLRFDDADTIRDRFAPPRQEG